MLVRTRRIRDCILVIEFMGISGPFGLLVIEAHPAVENQSANTIEQTENAGHEYWAYNCCVYLGAHNGGMVITTCEIEFSKFNLRAHFYGFGTPDRSWVNRVVHLGPKKGQTSRSLPGNTPPTANRPLLAPAWAAGKPLCV